MRKNIVWLFVFAPIAWLWATTIPSESSNYVVIGAFSFPKNAATLAQHAKRLHFDANVEFNPARNLYYVYVLHTGNRDIAIEQARRLRQSTPYNDTWVYSGLLGMATRQPEAGEDIHPESAAPFEIAQPSDRGEGRSVEGEQPVEKEQKESALPSHTDAAFSASGEFKNFYFKVFSAATGQPIAGDVNLFDGAQRKKLASYQANREVRIAPGPSGDVSVECEVFGYRKVTHAINYANPEAVEGTSIENNKITVPFELVRLKKGDHAVMYHVYFFKDAAIMRPESRYEVTALIDMMKENPRYKIRIHGHTNGNAPGKILAMGTDKNFFSLTGASEGFGSAKKLSAERGEAIRHYLIAQGIDASRLQVKAWGGKKPVYQKDHTQAQANVRVEIEILEE
jgi:outer membrane protein OmpA-like peptidoglycan-associated protein